MFHVVEPQELLEEITPWRSESNDEQPRPFERPIEAEDRESEASIVGLFSDTLDF